MYSIAKRFLLGLACGIILSPIPLAAAPGKALGQTGIAASDAAANAEQACGTCTHTVVDMVGRVVAVPDNIRHAAALRISSYEKMLLLGQVDRIGVVMKLRSPWSFRIFPGLRKARQLPVSAAMDPSIEDMVSNQVDLVFFWNRPEIFARLATIGIPVLVPQSDDLNVHSTLETFIQYRTDDMRMHGDIFGADARQQADAWVAYFKEKVAYVHARTSRLPKEQRPRVYYVRGPDALTTHAKYSFTWWGIHIAGGEPVTSGQTRTVVDNISTEELIAQDPQVVFMGWLPNTDIILKDAKWASLRAVKDHRVLVNPSGVYNWDYGSEAPLLILYMAKVLHPDLFQDINMTDEVRAFYARFYDYQLSDDEVRRILAHLPPQEEGR